MYTLYIYIYIYIYMRNRLALVRPLECSGQASCSKGVSGKGH